MGKIRVKSFGDQEQEQKDKRLAAKRAEKKTQKNKLKEETAQEAPEAQTPEQAKPAEPEKKAEPKKSRGARSGSARQKEGFRSANYKSKLSLVDRTKEYSLDEALKLLDEAHMTKFDETVELHVNTLQTGVSGNMTLPHGTGKQTRVAIASDDLIAEIEKGKISFDILLASPEIMPKLAKVAKVLGPRGLMPNPKNGTITSSPQDLIKKYEAGAINFKTETKAPIIHLVVGKLSFGVDKLSQNIETAIGAIKKANIRDITLKSTMSPGIKIKA